MTMMLIAFTVLLLVLLIAGALARNSLRVENIQLRLELADVKARLESMTIAYQGMKDIAARALEIGKKSAGLNVNKLYTVFDDAGQYQRTDYLPDPDSYSVKFCPKCNVSIRGTVWPTGCPACGVLFGDELDADEIG